MHAHVCACLAGAPQRAVVDKTNEAMKDTVEKANTQLQLAEEQLLQRSAAITTERTERVGGQLYSHCVALTNYFDAAVLMPFILLSLLDQSRVLGVQSCTLKRRSVS